VRLDRVETLAKKEKKAVKARKGTKEKRALRDTRATQESEVTRNTSNTRSTIPANPTPTSRPTRTRNQNRSRGSPNRYPSQDSPNPNSRLATTVVETPAVETTVVAVETPEETLDVETEAPPPHHINSADFQGAHLEADPFPLKTQNC